MFYNTFNKVQLCRRNPEHAFLENTRIDTSHW